MNIFTSYFHHADPQRREEFKFCLEKNLANEHIKKVIVLDESGAIPFPIEHDKLIRINSKRPTYHDFFQLTKDYPNDINIITNSDIFFDETIEKAKGIQAKTAYCITRHELREGRAVPFEAAHTPRGGKSTVDAAWSQDVWVFKGFADVKDCETVRATNTNTNGIDVIKFWLGIGGCDNIICKRIKFSGYQLKNPYQHIRCIHHHQTPDRPEYSHRMTDGGHGFRRIMMVRPTSL